MRALSPRSGASVAALLAGTLLSCSRGAQPAGEADLAGAEGAADLGSRDLAAADLGAAGCDPALPAGWPAALTLASANPLLVATAGTAAQGADNVYAPDLHEFAGLRIMWYGAQGADGHDRVYLAWSRDGAQWRKWPSDAAPAPVLDVGTSNHVNDPSVLRVGDGWRMYYTDAPTAENDEIWLAESATLTGFRKTARVLGRGPVGAWDGDKVGRPSVLYEGGLYRMWYDGSAGGRRHVGLATSADGVTFTRAPQNPVLLDAGAVDVKRVGGVYVMLREGGDGTYLAISKDGVCWVDRGKLVGLSGGAFDRYGQVTPSLELDGDRVRALWFGGASAPAWNKNRIAAAFPMGAAPSGGGCSQCTTAGLSCAAACQAGGRGAEGSCAFPGSTMVGMCCACQPSGCEACASQGDCQAACVANGKAAGYCAFPGSGEVGRCCACVE